MPQHAASPPRLLRIVACLGWVHSAGLVVFQTRGFSCCWQYRRSRNVAEPCATRFSSLARSLPTSRVAGYGLLGRGAARQASLSSLATLSATSAAGPRYLPPALSCVVDQITSPLRSTSLTAAEASCLRSRRLLCSLSPIPNEVAAN